MATKVVKKTSRKKVFPTIAATLKEDVNALDAETLDAVKKRTVELNEARLASISGTAVQVAIPMMPKSRRILQDLSVTLSGAGALLIGYDMDEKGTDDWTGHLLEYSGEAIETILSDRELPPLPEFLSYGLDGKLGMQGKYALLSIKIGIGFAQNQLIGHPKVEATFKYINKAINCLLAGRPVPAAPPALVSAN